MKFIIKFMKDLRHDIEKRETRPKKRVGSFSGFNRKFPLNIEPEKPHHPYDPNSPYLPKGQYSVATKIVAADGSGDFEDIQEAINDLPSTGGVVYIKEGTYSVKKITFPYDHISLIGSGPSTKLLLEPNVSNDVQAIYISKNYITISDLILDGNASNQSATNFDGIDNGGSFLTIFSCIFQNFSGPDSQAITSSGTSTYIESCHFSSSSCGVMLLGPSPSVVSSIFSCSSPIFDSSASSGYYVNNEIESASGDAGIFLEGSSNTLVLGNLIKNCSTYGIVVGASNSIIANNFCLNNGSYAGIISEDSERNVISGNICIGQRYGIYVEGCDRTLITSNLVLDNSTNLYLAFNTNIELGHNITS